VQSDHGRNLQRAGNGDDVIGRAGFVERACRAIEQRVGEIVMKRASMIRRWAFFFGRMNALPCWDVPAMNVSGGSR
jgi:hypothetical protein